MSNFIIYALPRSRTAWCSKFLTYRDHSCGHELAVTMRTCQDYYNYFGTPNQGSAETGISQGHWLLKYANPNIKEVVIHKPIQDVINSLMSLDLSGVAKYNEELLFKHMSYGYRMLKEISNKSGVLTVEFKDLKYMEVCKKLFEHCLPYEFDVKWWGQLKNQNIQVNVKDHFRYYHKHKEEIQMFKKLCKLELIKLHRQGKI